MFTNILSKMSKEGILTLTIDTKKIQGPSKSGKTRIIASSNGNQMIPESNGVIVGLNVYTKDGVGASA